MSPVCDFFWDCLRDFQTVIAGLVGFLGVVIALLWNSSADLRRRRDNEIIQANRLRASLVSELGHIIDFMEVGLQRSNDVDNHSDMLVPIANLDRVFVESIGRLGDLTSEEIRVVIGAYAQLDTYWSTLNFLGAVSESHPNHIRLEGCWTEVLQAISDHVIKAARAAIDLLLKPRY